MATPDMVLQDGDLLHLVIPEAEADRVEAAIDEGPEEHLMRVAIAGAGAVGRSVAAELLENGHEVLLIDKDPRAIKADSVPNAEWLLADACELSSLDEAALQRCDVVIASTGDDKANLVISLLAKTEFAVPRTVGRVNHPVQRVAVQRVVGRRRLGVDPAHHVRAGRGGGQRRRRGAAVDVPAERRQHGRAHAARRLALRRHRWSATSRGLATPRCSRCCARAMCTSPTPTPPSRPTTSCCSSRTPSAEADLELLLAPAPHQG